MKHEAYFKLNHRREQRSADFLFVSGGGPRSLARGQLFRDYALLHRRRIMEEKRIREEALRMQREEEEKRRVRDRLNVSVESLFSRNDGTKQPYPFRKWFEVFLAGINFSWFIFLRCELERSTVAMMSSKSIVCTRQIDTGKCVLEARRDGKHDPTNTHRRELLRERRERTMRLLEEKRLLHASKLEKEVAHEKAQRAKERVQRRQQCWKCGRGPKPPKRSHWTSVVRRKLWKSAFWRNDQKTSGHAKDSNETPTEFSQNVGGDSRYQDSTFDIVKKQWEEKERWKDERERILGPRHEAHGSALTTASTSS
ncbi:hypothetical protein TcYC6_0024230 [Trypanosoma cruzi]|nr:hypothetical protein TcYC6_0024230 [Trypanosoma cruzi]